MAEIVRVPHTFRCLDSGHTFDALVDPSAPAVLRQSATCPVHHCGGVAHSQREHDDRVEADRA